MAFDFLGTIKSFEQFEEFKQFVSIEASKIDERIIHIRMETQRLSTLLGKFSSADIKLRGAYSLSDNPDIDWIVKNRPTTPSKATNIDVLTAIDVDYLKKGFLDGIKARRERNEFKIKRILDLIDQNSDEISLLTELKDKYLERLNKIRGRFDLPDFNTTEANFKTYDPADSIKGIRETERTYGKRESGGYVVYLVSNISSTRNSLTFVSVSPPLTPGVKFVISGGKNDGEKTVKSIINSRTIEVVELVVDENPSTSTVSGI